MAPFLSAFICVHLRLTVFIESVSIRVHPWLKPLDWIPFASIRVGRCGSPFVVKTTSIGVPPPRGSCLAQVMSHLCVPKKDATSRQNATKHDKSRHDYPKIGHFSPDQRPSAVKLYRAENFNLGHVWSRLVTFGHLSLHANAGNR